MKQSLGWAVLSVITLAACGGSSSDDNSSGGSNITPPTTGLERCSVQTDLNIISTDSPITFNTQPQYVSQQSSAIVAKIDNGKVSDYQFNWSQTAGNDLILKSIKSPVLAFTAEQSGSYSFNVSVTAAGETYNESIEIDVVTANSANIVARLDQQAAEQNGVSFRVDDNPNLSSLSWCVAAGPDLDVDVSSPFQALYTAPSVNEDTISILRVSGNINGNTVTDDVISLITDEATITSPYFEERVANTFAYKPDSPYADAIEQCVYSNQLQQSCSIQTLPLIGQTGSVNKQAILDRLLVSHQWMGENFEYVLDNLDPNSDFATLLQSVTAVVISYDVRPSFYWVVTGAIYLDPTDLWLLKEERDTINEAPDYRSGFGNDLQFLMPWRYVKNNSYTSYIVPRSERVNRTAQQMLPDLASLLYHELAHANDFFPRSVHASLVGPTLLDDYERRSNNSALISDQLANFYPLNSQEMTQLANVSFRGETATNTQENYLAADVTSFFSPDRASDYYAYSTRREDAAMLFEEAMMSHRYAIQRDVAVTDKPDNATASSIIVDWGQRGRIGDPKLESRAAFVIDQMMPELNGSTIVTALPEPIPMIQGNSWAGNLAISPATNSRLNSPSKSAINAQPVVAPPLRLSGDRHIKPIE
ncbi:hypothetical protein [Shewanella fidelis]|uniref:Lipoprotein n=1 Tax=Shewanella fidelis TaxID=173509 RepID=A0AAW8NP86_9GAMM|nr:hypothetical protein [Shewanella fidelis]MDR8523976.1 hypothetical protein [Shewanella fidelis]MDW4810523.1 hypothetical protein [Shewanella fidelis]MDW4814644.1 hypothetical protein [Shewanella fidelis]MDW4818734.1 hypothetical protein [Shewanella fidelis]MDW4823589.1 hypothetical protein [Shewanella fidelis]